MDRKKMPDRKTKIVRTTYAIGELKYARNSRSTMARMLRIRFFALFRCCQLQENFFETHRCRLQLIQAPSGLHNRAGQIRSNISLEFPSDPWPRPPIAS